MRESLLGPRPPAAEAVVRQLESLWESGQRPDPDVLLAAADVASAVEIAAVLAADQWQRWYAGERIPAEDYLARHPALEGEPEIALELIYGEFLVREQLGVAPAPAEYLARFPHHAERLRQQFDLHRQFDASRSQADSAPAAGATTIDQSGTFRRPPPAGTTWPTLPGYEVLKELGRGGMGVVYQARQVALNRMVALKLMRWAADSSADERARFRAEAEAVARLQHPNVVQIFEVGEQEGRPFFSLEFVGGGSLARHLDGTPRPAQPAAALVETLARAVHVAHAQGIVHRDLKPANVLLTPDAVPKVTDFGLAKLLDSDSGQTRSGAIMGTPSYMAPEQAEGNARAVGPAADVYGLGAILYELLTGRPPFRAETPLDTVMQVVHEEPVPPSRLNPRLPRDLETICLKCLQKDPAKRYASAEALAEDLRRYGAGEPIKARPVGRVEWLWRWCRRKPVVAGLSLAVLLTFFVGLGVSLHFGMEANRKAADLALQVSLTDAKAREADAKAKEAEQERAKVWRLNYPGQISLMARTWERGDVAGVQDILASLIPRPGEEDLRGFEWHHFWRLAHGYQHSFGGRDRPVVSAMLFLETQLLTGGKGHLTIWDLKREKVDSILASDAQVLYRLLPDKDCKPFVVAATGTTLTVLNVIPSATRNPYKLVPVAPAPLETGGEVAALALAPDASALAALIGPPTAPRRVRCWDLATGRPRFTSEPGAFQALAFAPDNTRLAVGVVTPWAANHVVFLDSRTGKEVGKLERRSGGEHVEYSPDGSLLATGERSIVSVWEMPVGRRVARFDMRATIGALRFSRDGKMLAVGPAGQPGPLRYFDSATGRKLSEFWGHTGDVRQLAFAAGGWWLVSAGEDGTAKVWQVPGKPRSRVTPPQAQAPYRVNALAFRPDGQVLVTAGEDQTARVWDFRSGRLLSDVHLVDPVLSLAYSPDGRVLATGTDQGLVWLLSPDRALSPGTTLKETVAVQALAFAPDSHVLAIGTAGRSVRLHALAGGPVVALRSPPLHITALAYSPDGRLLAAAADGGRSVWLWDTVSGRPRPGFPKHGHHLHSVAFAPDGKRLAAGSCGWARLWDLGGKELGTAGSAFQSSGAGLVFLPDGRLVVGSGNGNRLGSADLLEVGNRVGPRPLWSEGGEVTSLALSPDGKVLAGGTYEGSVELWKAGTGEGLSRLPGHARAVASLAYAPDGRTLAAGRTDFTVQLLDGETLAERGRLTGHQASVSVMAYSPDGKTLATSGGDRVVLLWDLATGRPRARLSGHEKPVRCLAFSPDSALLASGDGRINKTGVVRLWDARTGALRGTLKPDAWSVTALAFAGDSRTLACGTGPEYANVHGSLSLWDVATGRRLADLSEHLPDFALATHRLQGHAKSITGAVFAPAAVGGAPEGLLATASWDQTVRLWDVRGRRQLAVLKGHDLAVAALAYSPKDAALVSVDERAVRFWDVVGQRERGVIPLRDFKPSALAVRPDGRMIVLADPRWDVPHALRAGDAANERDYAAAQATVPLERPAADDLQLIRARASAAGVLIGQGLLTEADEVLGQALALWRRVGTGRASARERARPVGAEVYFMRGRLLLQRDDPAAAALAVGKALRLQPDYIEAHALLGDALARQGEWTDAVEAYGEAALRRLEAPELWAALGKALVYQGDAYRARALLRSAIRRDPDDYASYRYLAFAELKLGNRDRADLAFRDALVIVEKRLARESDSALVRHWLAFLLDEWANRILAPAGRHAEENEARRRVVELAERVVEANPAEERFRKSLADSRGKLAVLLANCPDATFRDPPRAVEQAKQAVELMPKDGQCWHALGAALYRTGRWKEARAALDRATALRGGNGLDFVLLAMTDWQLGARQRARQWYARAVAWGEQNRSQSHALRPLLAEAAVLLGMI